MSEFKRKAAILLARGVDAVEVAKELSVSATYISQIQQDDEFQSIYKQIVAQRAVNTHSQYVEIDTHYDSFELKLIKTMDENSDVILASMIDKPAALLTAVRTMNGAKRRAMGEQQNTVANTEVSLQLPAFLVEQAKPKVVHNVNNEVVQVGDKPLVSLSGVGIKKQRDKIADGQNLEQDRVEIVEVAPEKPSALQAALGTLEQSNELDLGSL